jgi:hypothetical protein
MSSIFVLGRESPSTYRLVRFSVLAPFGLDGSHFEQPIRKALPISFNFVLEICSLNVPTRTPRRPIFCGLVGNLFEHPKIRTAALSTIIRWRVKIYDFQIGEENLVMN